MISNSLFRSFYFYSFLLVIVILIVFYPGLNNGFFCWDDKAIALAPAFQHFTFHTVFQSFFSFHYGLYHPLTSLSFMFDYFTGNGNPFSFHLTNLLLHIANTILLLTVLSKLTGNLRVSFIASLLFAIHPIHVESVAWITSRKDLLFPLFYFLSILVYSNYLEKGRKVLTYILLMFCVIFALLAKIPAITLPFIFLLIDYFNRRKLNTRMILEKVPFFIMSICLGFLNFFAQKTAGLISYGFHYSFLEKSFLFVNSIAQYFFKILFPYPLSVFYPYPFKPGESIPIMAFLLIGLILLVFALVLFLKKKDNRPVIFGFLFFLFNIIIVSAVSLNRDFVIAERYAYLPSVGILFILAIITDDIISNYNKYKIIIGGLLFFWTTVFSVMTYKRNVLWKDSEGLFRQALSVYSNSDIILNTLATQEIESGKFNDAIMHLDKAIRLSPDYCDAYFNRGIAKGKTGDFDSAIRDQSNAIKINPGYYEAYFARGNDYMKTNKLNNAFGDFSKVVNLNRNHFGAFQNRAIVRGNMGDFAGAIGDLDAAISLNPEFAASYYLRGIALFNSGGNGCADLYKSLSMGYKESKRAIDFYCR
jgi:protein O-mannosyl-transferase